MMTMSDYYNNLKSQHPDVAARYVQKIQKNVGLDPYCLSLNELSFNPKDFPSLSNMDIVSYLVLTTSFYTKEQMKAFKSLHAYKFFEAGFVTQCGVKRVGDIYIVIGRVKHSQRMNEPDLRVWVLVNTDGSVETAHCSCIAGAGEVCSHVGAILFALEYVETTQASTSCTDIRALWKIPKSKEVQYEPIKNINFGKIFKSPVLHQLVQPLQGADIVSFLKNIEEAGSSSVLMRVIEPFASEIATLVSTLWINPFKNLYREEYEHLSREELIALAQHVCISLTSEECSEIEFKTRSQRSSREWFHQRTGRITASKFKAACCATIEKPPSSLLKIICYPVHHNIRVPALAYGRLHEKDAVNAYKQHMEPSHEQFEVNSIGLQLNPKFPEFGASPDMMVSCTCCNKGCLEVKCPYLLSSMTIENFVKLKKTCLLQNENGDIYLDNSHDYFYQTQMQMAMTNTSYCDFVIWSPSELYIERIFFNEDFFHLKAAKAQDFHRKVVLPELMGKCFLKTNVVWCTCKGEDDGRPMIMCDDDNCDIMWYHLECVGLENVPDNVWKCQFCEK